MKLLNKRLDYAFCALQHIKDNQGRKVLASEIAGENDIPRKYLSKILRSLVEANIIKSHFGPMGGYALVRKPEEVTFMDVFEAVSGSFFVVDCLDNKMSRCRREEVCSHKRVWEGVHSGIKELLQRQTLSDI